MVMDAATGRPNTSAQNAARLKREHFGLIGAFVAPATEMECQLTPIWQSVLDIDGLGVEDDFFELGGESLTAVTLFAEMEQLLGQMPPLSTLLDYPTIHSLAGHLEQLKAIARERLLLTVRADGRRTPLFQAHAAYGNVLFVRKLLPFLHAEQPLYAIQARGLHEGEIPHRSFASMATDYVSLIRRVQPTGPYFLAGHCVGGMIAFEMAQHLKALGQDVGAVVMIDPEYHPNAVPWLHWRNPRALHVRLRQKLIRPVWFAQRKLRRTRDILAGRRVLSPPTETGANLQRQKAIIAGIKAALKAYRPLPYKGKLVIICSRERRKHLSNPATGWGSFAPQVEFIELGNSHDEVFFAALPAVGAAIQRVLDAAQPASLRPSERRITE